jgi:hypothetical protein
VKTHIQQIFLIVPAQAQYKKCIIFLHSVNTDLVHNPNLVKKFFDVPELICQFNIISVEITINIHVSTLQEIIPTQPLCLLHISLIILEINLILLIM